jgi:hypothetical protein
MAWDVRNSCGKDKRKGQVQNSQFPSRPIDGTSQSDGATPLAFGLNIQSTDPLNNGAARLTWTLIFQTGAAKKSMP